MPLLTSGNQQADAQPACANNFSRYWVKPIFVDDWILPLRLGGKMCRIYRFVEEVLPCAGKGASTNPNSNNC